MAENPYPNQAVAVGIGPTQSVVIQQVENGFLVTIGCKSFVFSNMEDVVTGVSMYFRDPEQARKKYCKN